MSYKHLEGKIVYLMPTGNNARRSKPNAVFAASVIKVARVNMTFVMDGFSREEVMRMEDYGGHIHLSSGHNSGYLVFESMSEYDAYLYKERIKLELRRTRVYEWIDRLSVDQIETLCGWIGIDPDSVKKK